MADFVVTHVRREWSADRSHRHLEGVITSAGVHYTRREVVDSIRVGRVWETSCEGYRAVIQPIAECWRSNCRATPYIKTKPDSTKKDNLENLPEG
jgi:hypothetical protein